MKQYNSLADLKEDWNAIASQLIDLVADDRDVVTTLESASRYFNYLTEDDFNTSDQSKINEACAVISRSTKRD